MPAQVNLMSTSDEPHAAEGAAVDAEQKLALIDAIDALAAVSERDGFLACVDGPVRKVLPHDGLVCGMANNITQWNPHVLVLHRFPESYMERIRKSSGGYDSEMIRQWRSTRVPVLADPDMVSGRWWSDEWMANARTSGLTNLAGHGFVDVKGEAVSYFCFVRIAEPLGPRCVYLLDRLVPHLHLALLHSVGNAGEEWAGMVRPPPVPDLSARQLEILKWMRQGKTNPEISMITGVGEANVKYHVKVIFAKLDVVNRAAAVSRAISLGLLQPD